MLMSYKRLASYCACFIVGRGAVSAESEMESKQTGRGYQIAAAAAEPQVSSQELEVQNFKHTILRS